MQEEQLLKEDTYNNDVKQLGQAMEVGAFLVGRLLGEV